MSCWLPFFDSEDAAVKGMRTLERLHEEGGVSLYSSALIVRGRDGNISVKQQSDPSPLGTALGLLTGGLIGILGGPAGSAVAASLGGYVGLLADGARHGIDYFHEPPPQAHPGIALQYLRSRASVNAPSRAVDLPDKSMPL
jgi:uncharacterized membrane protein